MLSRSALAIALIALVGTAAAKSASSPSVAESGKATYTVSSDGVKMLFVNPYDCEKAATDASTWVIELEQPETVFSFQVALVGGDLADDKEQITVRVGDNDPKEGGASSNSLCAVAELTTGSAMDDYECQKPATGSFITITRNDGGKMNICGFSANLGFAALAPVNALAPSVSVPASQLNAPRTSEPAPRTKSTVRAPTPSELATFRQQGLQSFAAAKVPVPAPALAPKSPASAPKVAVKTTTPLPKTVRVPAPAPSPHKAPKSSPYRVAVKAPAPVPAPLASVVVDAPTPSPASLPRNIFVADQPQPTPAAVDAAGQIGSSGASQTGSAANQTGSAASSATPHTDSGLSNGAIAGIVLGCLAGVALAGVVAYAVYEKRGRAPPQRRPLSSRVNPVYNA